MNRKASIFIGFDPREADAFAVACASVRAKLTRQIPLYGLVLNNLQERGLYTRPTESKVNGDGRRKLVDVLSKRDDYDGAMSTEFAISRFLVPHLAHDGLAMFMDADMLVRGNIVRLFEQVERDAGKAIYCVKHDHRPTETTKMDGQKQSQYSRKNWSSMFIIDVDHPANKALTVEAINTLPGRDLHRFCWLDDEEIGELGAEWNWLVGYSPAVVSPQIVHFTEGTPSMDGHESDEYADEWRKMLSVAAVGAMGFGS